ncbi:DUF221-domain-containing protein [Mytilinidion resinicola]|uniref:DUF221-domain-containing protein n=1 Tax=Mytilinidion resinicola TaxID=574789 RepID=A0A6A6ZBK8_9PEZI|nr:DUF221-domain-containing protein [Mytilinidion resinicola]KAF2817694.1 DUF221-domain-containing protein [Mytilinidion resinicola]
MSTASATQTAISADGTSTGSAHNQSNMSLKTFWASLASAAVVFGIQMGAFLILSGNWKFHEGLVGERPETRNQSLFHRIYFYKTSFVSKSKQIAFPSSAIESFKNVFTLPSKTLIRVAGVDGYLFLRYLQLLLKIFVPMAIVILPILLPLNRVGDVKDVSGMDSFGWTNVAVANKVNRLWAHLILALLVVIWACYQFYRELRAFVRLRQTVLTQPEHRIRASATTILVQSIPRKWLTVEALDALYDVFPGGLREIWINRDYDELQDKIKKRTKIARKLEGAETDLIINCTKEHRKMKEKEEKAAGIKKSKKEKKQDDKDHNQKMQNNMEDPGMSSGNPHQIESAMHELLNEDVAGSSVSTSRSSSPDSHKRHKIPIPLVGEGLQAMGHGIRDVGLGVGKMGSKMVGGFRGAFKKDEDKQVTATSDLISEGQDDYAGIHTMDGTQDPASPRTVDQSPIDSDYGRRGPSVDDYARLNVPATDSEKGPGHQSLSQPQSQETPGKDETPTMKKHHLKTLKHARGNPMRRKSEFASPQPFHAEGTEFPFPTEKKKDEEETYDYSTIYNQESPEDDENALWRKYIKEKDRDTMRLPLLDKSWFPALPLLGKKVDTIYHCRKELARLNYEIEQDKANPEKYPLMNSAFIQFNHQVGAHMACQSLSHHIPRQMAPRTVEVNPNYVLWDNLSIKWWERYLRTTIVVASIGGLVILWGFPVSFTALVSQLSYLTGLLHWLNWINHLPGWVINLIQGVLPPAFMGILFAILPLLMRFLAGFSGVATAGEKELRVQDYYFAFVFIQLFLVVSISAGITRTIRTIIDNPVSIPGTLAKNLPGASTYFFSYMILQALSISSGTLLQIGRVGMMLLTGFLDTTARQKVKRVLGGSSVNWGTFIPVYTNFGAIGLIYSIISPLMMLFMILTFALFWFTYRYQMIYVSFAAAETNGLIFPKAINQLFTGLYFMELCLIGLFFLVRGPGNKVACFPQAIIMVVALVATVGFQLVLNNAFGPLYKYLPITFEDDAVRRDEEFERAQASRWAPKDAEKEEEHSLSSELEEQEKREEQENEQLEEEDVRRSKQARNSDAIEMKNMDKRRSGRRLGVPMGGQTDGVGSSRKRESWADRSRSRSPFHAQSPGLEQNQGKPNKKAKSNPFGVITGKIREGIDDAVNTTTRPIRDIEAQTNPEAYLFTDMQDALEDIEPEQRQKLIKRAFEHPATRAIQPAIWIPHDEIGITADEIRRTSLYSDKIWITSKNARLDAKGHVMFRGLPPDWDPFDNMEI